MGEIGGTFFESRQNAPQSSFGISPASTVQERKIIQTTVLGDMKDKRIQSAGKVSSQKGLITFQKQAPQPIQDPTFSKTLNGLQTAQSMKDLHLFSNLDYNKQVSLPRDKGGRLILDGLTLPYSSAHKPNPIKNSKEYASNYNTADFQLNSQSRTPEMYKPMISTTSGNRKGFQRVFDFNDPSFHNR